MFLVQTTPQLLTWLVIPHQNPQRPMIALVVLSYVKRRNPPWRNTQWKQNLQQAVGNKAVYLRFHWIGVVYTLHAEEQANPCRHKMTQMKRFTVLTLKGDFMNLTWPVMYILFLREPLLGFREPLQGTLSLELTAILNMHWDGKRSDILIVFHSAISHQKVPLY